LLCCLSIAFLFCFRLRSLACLFLL
jgi:hypothetical protein